MADTPTTIDEAEAELLADLVVTCFEGGSNHWIEEARPAADPPKRPGGNWYASPETFLAAPDTVVMTIAYSETERGEEPFTSVPVTVEMLTAGFMTLKRVNSRLHHDIIEEGGGADAEAADAWLQCAVLGDIVYG